MVTFWRMLVFLVVVLGVWFLMHAYVVARLTHLPWFAGTVSRRLLLAVAGALAVSYPLARLAGGRGWSALGLALEAVGSTWMALLFLLLVLLLAADLLTGFGALLPRLTMPLRSVAALAAVALTATGLAIGLADPVVREHEVQLPGLPHELDGTVVVAVSDLHVGSLIGPRWADRLVTRIRSLQPDLVCFVGDVVEGGRRTAAPFSPLFRRLDPPLGVWAVTGNHEHYVGLEESLAVFAEAGFRPLRDAWVEVAPGLVLAGVDDLTARRQFGDTRESAVARALEGRAQGAAILLSHTPWEVEEAGARGVGLVLSGHTHGGQIWPFGYLVRARYRFVGGRYQVEGTTLLVGRGTGTWGPRVRLWRPGEILRVVLRPAPA